jgi:hypothetical protein
MSDSIFSSRPAPSHRPTRAFPRPASATVPNLPPARAPAAPPAPSPQVVPDLPAAGAPAADVPAARPPRVPDLPPLRTAIAAATASDTALIAILDAPLDHGMTAREGFLRKEGELRAVFAALPVAAQRALHARLSNPRAADELATKFHNLTAERRTRLLNFLADARRREALAAAR